MNPVQEQTYASVAQEAQALRDKELFKYNFSVPVTLAIPYNTQRNTSIQVDVDADFMIMQLTGKVMGPTDESGFRLLDKLTRFPMFGFATGYAESGLQVAISEGGSGRELTEGYVPIENLVSPGYGVQQYIPYTFKKLVRAGTKLNFDFANRDVPAGGETDTLYHYVSLLLNGYKITTKSK